LLFELSGEHPRLALKEIIAALSGLSIQFELSEDGSSQHTPVISFPQVTSYEQFGEIAQRVSKRVSLCHAVHLFLAHSNSERGEDVVSDLCQDISPIQIGPGARTFRVRSKWIGNTPRRWDRLALEREIGRNILSRNPEMKVALEGADVEFKVLLSDHGAFLGRELARIDRASYDGRKAQFRPYFSPISLHPRIARAMVNLSVCLEGGLLLDPFCGTGGILIEAGLSGLQVVGGDFDKEMIEGCEKNLEDAGISPLCLLRTDINDLRRKLQSEASCDIPVDAVVTDPPYGRSSSSGGQPLDQLYSQMYTEVAKLIRPGGTFVVSLPEKKFIDLVSGSFKVLWSYSLREHRSLTRSIYVLNRTD